MQDQMVDQQLKYKVKDITLAKWGRMEILGKVETITRLKNALTTLQ